MLYKAFVVFSVASSVARHVGLTSAFQLRTTTSLRRPVVRFAFGQSEWMCVPGHLGAL